MGERPDEIRRDPLGETRRDPDSLVDPAMEPVGPISGPGLDPALGGGVGGGAMVEEPDPCGD